jgi:hypothetical protein
MDCEMTVWLTLAVTSEKRSLGSGGVMSFDSFERESQ